MNPDYRKLKVAVLGKNNHLDWDRHVASAFREIGCQVFHAQINRRPVTVELVRAFSRITAGKYRARQVGDELHARHLYRRLREFRPDLVFITSAFFASLEYYKMARELPGHPVVAAWDGDGGPNLESSAAYVNLIDLLCEAEELHVQQNTRNFKEIIHLPFCANPGIYKDLQQERVGKLYFCGVWTPERDALVTRIQDFPMVIRGLGWKKLSASCPNHDIAHGLVSIPDLVQDYNRFRYVLNIHQVANCMEGINMRAFEITACGALLLNDDKKELPYYFDDTREVLVYRNKDELTELLHRCESDTKWADSIRINGRQRTLSEHTYRHRMEKVLKHIFP